MPSSRRLLPALISLLLVPLPGLSADARVEPVTASNLLQREQDWPYQVGLVAPFQPAGREAPLPLHRLGVLIRVENASTARIDFGRYGRHDVPIESTDLVERANRVQRGEIRKLAPNFVLAIRTRLVEARGESLRPLPASRPGQVRRFLCVFADPRAEAFPELAADLAPLAGAGGTMVLLVPQGEPADRAVRDRLQELGWDLPFVTRRFARAETEAQLGTEAALPHLLLQTAEGRLLFDGPWQPGLVSRLEPLLSEASSR